MTRTITDHPRLRTRAAAVAFVVAAALSLLGAGSADASGWMVSHYAGTGHYTPAQAGPALSESAGYPHSVVVDSAGNVYFDDCFGYHIMRVTPAGQMTVFAGDGQSGAAATGEALQSPETCASALAVDTYGNVYAAFDSDSEIVEISTSGEQRVLAGTGKYGSVAPTNGGTATAQALKDPSGIAVDSFGDVYFTDAALNGLYEIVGTRLWLVRSGFNQPVGLAADSSGDLYIDNNDSFEVDKLSPSGQLTTIAGNGQYGSEVAGPAMNSPFGLVSALTVDSNGNVYIADSSDSTIDQITPGGTLSVIDQQVRDPQGIGVDPASGAVYIGNTYDYYVDKLTYDPSPGNVTAPSISGSAVVGDTLTADPGTWTNTQADSFSYQWDDCDTGGLNCRAISGATSSMYSLAKSDEGSTIEVVVTDTNTGGDASASSAATAVVVAPVPVNTVAPSVSGDATVGSALSATSGSWSNADADSFAYQWEDCDGSGLNCQAISGATSSTYTVASSDLGDTLEVFVTDTNSGGPTQAASSPTGVVVKPPVPVSTSAPVVSSSAGALTVGSTLSASTGSWSSNTNSYSYKWVRCDTNGMNCLTLTGATSSSYTPTYGDVGHTIEVVVTDTNAGGSSSTSSAPTAVIASPTSLRPANTQAPLISGTFLVGSTLTATPGTWSNDSGDYAYKWERCDSSSLNCLPLTGATASSYKLVSGDAGHTIEVIVTDTNSYGSASATSPVSAVIAVLTAPVNTVAPSITGTTQVAGSLAANVGSWSNYAPDSFSYKWERCDVSGLNCLPLTGATSSTYTPTWGDEGHTIVVIVTDTNPTGSKSVTSAATGLIGAPAASAHVLGAVRLGMTRGVARRAEARFTAVACRSVRGCAASGSGVSVRYVHGRAALITTDEHRYAIDGVRPGMTLRAATARLHLARAAGAGESEWHVIQIPRGHLVLNVTDGRIREIGIASQSLLRSGLWFGR